MNSGGITIFNFMAAIYKNELLVKIGKDKFIKFQYENNNSKKITLEDNWVYEITAFAVILDQQNNENNIPHFLMKFLIQKANKQYEVESVATMPKAIFKMFSFNSKISYSGNEYLGATTFFDRKFFNYKIIKLKNSFYQSLWAKKNIYGMLSLKNYKKITKENGDIYYSFLFFPEQLGVLNDK